MGIKDLITGRTKPNKLVALTRPDYDKCKVRVLEWREHPQLAPRHFATIEGYEGLGVVEAPNAIAAANAKRPLIDRATADRGAPRADDVRAGLEALGFCRAKLAGRPVIYEHPKTGASLLFPYDDGDQMAAPIVEVIAIAAGVTVEALEDASGITALRELTTTRAKIADDAKKSSWNDMAASYKRAEAARYRKLAADATAAAERAEAELAKIGGDAA